MLTTLLPPTAGTARVGGFDVAHAKGRRCARVIGAALQEAALDPLLTGREHLRLQMALQACRGPSAERAATSSSTASGSRKRPTARSRGYSGGMKRRLDLALALVHRPRILFLDEPTTGLDPQSRTALWEEVARLAREEGVTVFLTTQYLEEADVLADRVGIIDKGMIVAEGTPAALKAEIGRPERRGGARATTTTGRGSRRPARGSASRSAATAASPCASTTALGLADVVRALDADGPRGRGRRAARPDARRRLPREDRAHARGRRRPARTRSRAHR